MLWTPIPVPVKVGQPVNVHDSDLSPEKGKPPDVTASLTADQHTLLLSFLHQTPLESFIQQNQAIWTDTVDLILDLNTPKASTLHYFTMDTGFVCFPSFKKSDSVTDWRCIQISIELSHAELSDTSSGLLQITLFISFMTLAFGNTYICISLLTVKYLFWNKYTLMHAQ